MKTDLTNLKAVRLRIMANVGKEGYRGEGIIVAEVAHAEDEAECVALAKLFAAAPDLLEACKGLFRIVEAFSYTTQLGKTQEARMAAARAAIAKATP